MLARRPFLGLELRARQAADEGLEVVRVTPQSAAFCAGIRAADRLLLVNDQPFSDARMLARYVRTLEPDAALSFVVDRSGERLVLNGRTIPLPIEKIASADVVLGEIDVNGHRLRTLLTIPKTGAAPFSTILYLPGLGTQSCELSMDPDEPLRHFIQGMSAAGIATFRVERYGVGDSEGPPFSTTNLHDDLQAYHAALAYLANHPSVGRIFLFGHSIGGMIAPLLAGEDSAVEGIAVFGTSSRRWVDCIVDATRRQKALGGMSGEELDEYVSAWARMHTAVCREKRMPAQVFTDEPDLQWLHGSACHGEMMFGRHATVFQQLERLNLPALWKTVNTKVLVMHGQYDWACAPEEGREIANVIAADRVQYVELSEVGHDMRKHSNLLQSYVNPRAGQFDDRVVEQVAQWVNAQV